MADYPSALYSAQTPATKRNATLTQAEWLAAIDEIEAIEAELGTNHKKRGVTNLLIGGSMESWSAGTTVTAPDAWTLSGTAATVQKSSDGQDGSFSAQITAGSVASMLSQTVVPSISATLYARLRGRTLTLFAYVKTSVALCARLQIYDGVGTSESAYHTGGGGWERLTVTRTLDAAATTLVARLLNDKTDSASTAKFDSAVLVEGEFSGEAFVPSPSDQHLRITNFQTTTPFNATDQGVWRAEVGQATTSASAGVTVTFQTAFRTIRMIQATAESTSARHCTVSSPAAGSFVIHGWDAAGARAAFTAHWIAIGQTA